MIRIREEDFNCEPIKTTKSTEVDPFWELSDIKNMLDYFELKEMHNWRLALVLGLTLGRRVSDILAFKVSNFFDKNGEFLVEIDITERKTWKKKTLPIAGWTKSEVIKYIKATGLDVTKEKYLFPSNKKEAYEAHIASGFFNDKEMSVYKCDFDTFDKKYMGWCEFIEKNYIRSKSQSVYKLFVKRNEHATDDPNSRRPLMTLAQFLMDWEMYDAVLTQSDSYRRAFSNAADFCGIKYSVSTHTPRKTFGYWSRNIHPYDIDSIDVLQGVFGHSDRKTTLRYSGINKSRECKYHFDIDDMMKNVAEGKEFKIKNSPVIANKTQDLMDLFLLAYEYGKDKKDSAQMLKDIFVMAEECAVR